MVLKDPIDPTFITLTLLPFPIRIPNSVIISNVLILKKQLGHFATKHPAPRVTRGKAVARMRPPLLPRRRRPREARGHDRKAGRERPNRPPPPVS